MINLKPTQYQVEDSSIYIIKINDKFSIVECDRYLNKYNEWESSPNLKDKAIRSRVLFSFKEAKKIINNYFKEI